jgi:hypothetical protein
MERPGPPQTTQDVNGQLENKHACGRGRGGEQMIQADRRVATATLGASLLDEQHGHGCDGVHSRRNP